MRPFFGSTGPSSSTSRTAPGTKPPTKKNHSCLYLPPNNDSTRNQNHSSPTPTTPTPDLPPYTPPTSPAQPLSVRPSPAHPAPSAPAPVGTHAPRGWPPSHGRARVEPPAVLLASPAACSGAVLLTPQPSASRRRSRHWRARLQRSRRVAYPGKPAGCCTGAVRTLSGTFCLATTFLCKGNPVRCPLSPLSPALPAPAFSMVKKNTIPDGWRSLTPVGQPIPGTRFIAFKVPLKGAINQRLTPTQKFTPKDLIAAMKALNVELGLIIDLTYTTRYYEVKDLPKSVQYKKLYTVGLEVPDNATILQFKKWVRKFLWENAGNEKLIGVHCTNGINRTGYLICRYLIDVEGWDPEAAIQAFGDARGHRMDGLVYLTDLRTQPMRSNLGMDVWDSDEDIIPPPHAMEGPVERFPNEDFQGSGKRLRIYDDHSHDDLQGQIQLRDFDFINKGPGQRRRPFHDHHTQDDLRAPMQMRNWDYNRGPGQRQRSFPDHQFYDDYEEDIQLKDPDFSNKGPAQRLRPFHGHQFHDDLQAERQSRDTEFNRGRGQRQRSFPDHPSHKELQEDRQSKDFDFGSRGHGQRRRPFQDHESHDEFQTQMQMKELDCVNKGPGQRPRSFHDYQSQDDLQSQMQLGDFEFVNRGRGQRLRHFNDHQPRNDLKTEMQLKDYHNKGPGQRRRPFHDHQPYDDMQEQTRLKDGNKGHGQRPRPFHDHPGHDDLPREWCSDR
ncbi:uncharacterized protein LOC130595480 [Pezoporus wallicus]|uniref:uncharacterized protein LOC130595480 n=1 Tax=Pezoporus wallicus TaxID=35540 RepID=UPI00254A3059|nr:uncharacterized protein LOC130595480 [Pezoporus wallicus]